MPLEELATVEVFREDDDDGYAKTHTSLGTYGGQVKSIASVEDSGGETISATGLVDVRVRRTPALAGVIATPSRHRVRWRGLDYEVRSVVEDDHWTLVLTVELVR